MFQQLKRKYKSQSFPKQLRISFFLTAFILIVMMIIISLFWRNALAKKIHQDVYKDISILSQKTEFFLTSIEKRSYDLIDHSTIQSQLLQLAHLTEEQTSEAFAIKDELTANVNELIKENTFIRNAYIISPTGDNLINFITSYDNILEDYSIPEIISQLPKDARQGKWFFNHNISQAVYARNIFSTINLSLEYVGTVLLLVDSSFFVQEEQNLPFHSEDNLYFLEYDHQLYSPSNDSHSATAFMPVYQKLQRNQSFQYGNIPFNETDYYVAFDRSDPFTFIYLVPDNQVLAELYRFQWYLLLVTIPLLLLIAFLIQKICNQLTYPLSMLANQMREIQQTKTIQSLKTLPLPSESQSEIRILYQSYNLMIEEINQLIKDNYEMRILSQEIEFKSLQAQLDPHFLYNTLDSINWIALTNKQAKISKMVTSLALLFRKKIDTLSEFTTIEDELEIIRAYVDIQEIRFENRIEYRELILINDLSFEIPKLLIQPLVENVFKHAVSITKTKCQIILSIEAEENNLYISVSDSGPGFKKDFDVARDGGVGLKNIQKRLSLHYGEKATLTISEPTLFKKTIVRFNIPIKEEIF